MSFARPEVRGLVDTRYRPSLRSLRCAVRDKSPRGRHCRSTRRREITRPGGIGRHSLLNPRVPIDHESPEACSVYIWRRTAALTNARTCSAPSVQRLRSPREPEAPETPVLLLLLLLPPLLAATLNVCVADPPFVLVALSAQSPEARSWTVEVVASTRVTVQMVGVVEVTVADALVVTEIDSPTTAGAVPAPEVNVRGTTTTVIDCAIEMRLFDVAWIWHVPAARNVTTPVAALTVQVPAVLAGATVKVAPAESATTVYAEPTACVSAGVDVILTPTVIDCVTVPALAASTSRSHVPALKNAIV
jgi:hypothetical protein